MDIRLFLRNEIRASFASLAAIATVLALSLALSISAMTLERSIRQSTAKAADSFDLLVGAKGSSSALLLGSVFLRDEFLSLMPASALQVAREKGGVKWLAPLAFGDRVGAAPLVGTTQEMVSLGGTRSLAQGRPFQSTSEAVVGVSSGLKLGDKFHPEHGRVVGSGSQHRETEFEVVGVLPQTGTPWDRAVIVPIQSVWTMHDHKHEHEKSMDVLSADALMRLSDDELRALPGFQSLVIKPSDFASAYRLRQHLSKTTLEMANGQSVPLTAVFSGEVLVDLYGSLDTAGKVLYAVTSASLAISLIAVVLFGLMLVHLRSSGLLTLRVMGAPARYVVCAVWSLVMTVIGWGALGGFVFGQAFAYAAAVWIAHQTGIAMDVTVSAKEGMICGVLISVGAVAALIPAFGVCRKASLR